jgi:hypothetical protein
MVPTNLLNKTATKPIKEEIVEDMPQDPEDGDIYEEEDLEDVGGEEPIAATNNPGQYQQTVSKQQIELQLELKLRKLKDVELQLITQKIAIKNEQSLTGVMTEDEMISFGNTLKLEIQALIDYMKANFKYDDRWFVGKFKEVEKGIKAYEYWVIPDKKK